MSGKNNNLEYEAVEEETDDEEEDDEKGNGREVWVGGVALRLPVDQRGREGHRRSPEGAAETREERSEDFPGAVRRFVHFWSRRG